MVLEEIQVNENKLSTSSIIGHALEQCLAHLESLHSIAKALSPGFISRSSVRRAWTAFDSVNQSEKISQFKAKLGEAKITLMLAQQVSAT